MKNFLTSAAFVVLLTFSVLPSSACEVEAAYFNGEIVQAGRRVTQHGCRSAVRVHDECAEATGAVAKFWITIAQFFKLV